MIGQICSVYQQSANVNLGPVQCNSAQCSNKDGLETNVVPMEVVRLLLFLIARKLSGLKSASAEQNWRDITAEHWKICPYLVFQSWVSLNSEVNDLSDGKRTIFKSRICLLA